MQSLRVPARFLIRKSSPNQTERKLVIVSGSMDVYGRTHSDQFASEIDTGKPGSAWTAWATRETEVKVENVGDWVVWKPAAEVLPTRMSLARLAASVSKSAEVDPQPCGAVLVWIPAESAVTESFVRSMIWWCIVFGAKQVMWLETQPNALGTLFMRQYCTDKHTAESSLLSGPCVPILRHHLKDEKGPEDVIGRFISALSAMKLSTGSIVLCTNPLGTVVKSINHPISETSWKARFAESKLFSRVVDVPATSHALIPLHYYDNESKGSMTMNAERAWEAWLPSAMRHSLTLNTPLPFTRMFHFSKASPMNFMPIGTKASYRPFRVVSPTMDLSHLRIWAVIEPDSLDGSVRGWVRLDHHDSEKVITKWTLPNKDSILLFGPRAHWILVAVPYQ